MECQRSLTNVRTHSIWTTSEILRSTPEIRYFRRRLREPAASPQSSLLGRDQAPVGGRAHALPSDVGASEKVQKRLKGLVEMALDSKRRFTPATRDPKVIDWALWHVRKAKGRIEFGLLMGFFDMTKIGAYGPGLGRVSVVQAS